MADRKLIKEMKARGWRPEISGKHMKFIHEETGQYIVCAHTASDYRAKKNMMAFVKRVEDGRVSARPER
jgi:predicted RNA binding protein YcfA (HicA-like mRNA interferase family)